MRELMVAGCSRAPMAEGIGVQQATACQIRMSLSWVSTHPIRPRSMRELAVDYTRAPMAGGVGAKPTTACQIRMSLTLAIDPSNPATLYAGTCAGLYKSTNGGGSWSQVNNGLPILSNPVVIDPSNPDTLYAGTSAGLYKSTNGGGSWSPVNNGLSNTNCLCPGHRPV